MNTSKLKEDQPEQNVDHPRKTLPKMSIKRIANTKWIIQFHEKRAKLDDVVQSSITAVCYDCVEPGCSKNNQPIKMQDHQPMVNARTKETPSASYDEQSTEQYNQTLSLLQVDVDDTTIDGGDCSECVKQPYETNSSGQRHLFSNTKTATMRALKVLTITEQKSKSQIAEVRSVASAYDDHEQRIKDVFKNESTSSTSHHLLNSRLMTAQLYRHIDGARRLVAIQQTVERQLRPMNIDRNITIAAQNPSNLINSVEEQSSVFTHNQSQDVSKVYQSRRIQLTSALEEGYKNQRTQKQLVDQSTESNSRIKRMFLTDAVNKSPVMENPPKVMNNTCQIEEWMIENSLYLGVTSNSDAVTDHEGISNQEIIIPEPEVNQAAEERPVEVTALSARDVSPSSNVTPKVQQAAEERPVEGTAKLKKHIFRFVLPPKYDRHDSRWTLKYRKNLPGLVELMPQSSIYVSYGDLKYCLLKSEDCKSLARRLLKGVFNRDALSVCSSMTEKAQASSTTNNVGCNVRPGLDEHATTNLLNFVIEHGIQCGWNTDLQPILSTLDRKIQEIRFKYGKMV